jgi:hypothetical protein
MAFIYVTEYAEIAQLNGESVSIAKEPELVEQQVAIGGASVQSSAFNAKTKFIRVHADAICSIKIGSSPTAVATAKRMAANQTEYFAVDATHKIAVITNT